MIDTSRRDVACEALVAHGNFVRALARSLLGNASDADDVRQEAALQALQHPPRDARAALRWLQVVTRRLAVRQVRGARRRAHHERRAARADRIADPAELAERQELLENLARAIRALSEEQRTVVLLHYYDGLALRQIAEHLRTPLPTVRSRHQRAVAHLRESLDRHYGHRDRWRRALVGMLAVRPASTVSLAAGKLVGIVLLVVLAVIGGTWLLIDGERESPGLGEPTAARGSLAARDDQSLPAPAPLPVRTPAGARITGRVVDPSGRPVPRAWVMAGRTPQRLRRLARTEDDGTFEVAGAAPGQKWCAVARGFSPSVVVAATDDAVELRLRPGGMVVSGTVTADDGRPIDSGEVLLGREDEPSAPTALQPDGLAMPAFVVPVAADGRFEHPGLYAGWFACTPRVAGFACRRTFHEGRSGETVEVELKVYAGVTLTGTVRSADGRPVAGAEVRAGGRGLFATRAARTDAGGAFRLAPIRRKGDEVVAEGPNGGYASVKLEVDAAAQAAVWDPVLDRAPLLAGVVVDHENRPVADLWVDAVRDVWPGWRRRVRTDARGRFEIARCPTEGELRVEVFRPGVPALPVCVREGVLPDQTEPLALKLAADCERTVRVSGQVCGWDGAPIAVERALLRPRADGRRLRLTDPTQPVALAPDGRFTVAAVPAGAFELVLVGPRFGWCRLPLPECSAQRDLDCGLLRLPRPGTVHVRLSKKPGADVSQGRYLLERLDVPQRIVEGRAELPTRFDLAPGAYRLEVEMLPGPLRDLRFTIRPGEVVTVDLTLDAHCRHVVRCDLPAGDHPEFLWLELFDLEREELGVRQYVEPDANGSYRAVLDLLPGRYRMTAVSADGRRGERELLVNTTVAERLVGIRLQ